MGTEPSELDALIARFKHLREADQAVILAQFPSDERERVLAVMTERELARQADVTAARQAGRRYAAYSPWLAKLARGAEDGALEGLTPTGAKALIEAHRLLASESGETANGLFLQARVWFERVLSPLGGTGR